MAGGLNPPDVALRRIRGGADEWAALQDVFTRAPAFAALSTGTPPDGTEAAGTWTALPPGKDRADKFVYAVDDDGETVGVVDLVRGWPDEATAMLGLLLIAEDRHGRGLGTATFARVLAVARDWPDCRSIRIGVLAGNVKGLRFWARMGFVPNGEVKPWRRDGIDTTVVVLLRDVGR